MQLDTYRLQGTQLPVCVGDGRAGRWQRGGAGVRDLGGGAGGGEREGGIPAAGGGGGGREGGAPVARGILAAGGACGGSMASRNGMRPIAAPLPPAPLCRPTPTLEQGGGGREGGNHVARGILAAGGACGGSMVSRNGMRPIAAPRRLIRRPRWVMGRERGGCAGRGGRGCTGGMGGGALPRSYALALLYLGALRGWPRGVRARLLGPFSGGGSGSGGMQYWTGGRRRRRDPLGLLVERGQVSRIVSGGAAAAPLPIIL
ncbi:hypothetical protein B0H14DRAFT_3426879 [Mycena olivaceomarginata]|nr:hypothetical protein B0H14DRAFT_3426879 [Mycena olivaceomarginata]